MKQCFRRWLYYNINKIMINYPDYTTLTIANISKVQVYNNLYQYNINGVWCRYNIILLNEKNSWLCCFIYSYIPLNRTIDLAFVLFQLQDENTISFINKGYLFFGFFVNHSDKRILGFGSAVKQHFCLQFCFSGKHSCTVYTIRINWGIN